MKFFLRALASTVVAGAAVLAGAPSALAAPRHVGVVVRYGGGRVAAGCTTVGGSGLQVLERKHWVTMGTQQYSGFVLRIDGVGTSRPDNTHYWSYWHSSGHGGWTYASSGAASYTPRAGTVEGWSFVNGQNSAPRPPSYTYAALCGHLDPKPAPTPAPKPTSSSPAPTHSTSQSTSRAAPAPVHRTPVQPPTSSAPTRTVTRSHAAVVAPPSAHPHTSRTRRASASASQAPISKRASPTRPARTAPTTKVGPTSAAPSPVAQPTDTSSSSAAWPTIGALLVVAALGVTAWLVARRRAG